MKFNITLIAFLVLITPVLAKISFSPILKNVDQALAGIGGVVLSALVASSKDASIEKIWKEIQKLGPQAGRAVLAEATKVYSEAVTEQFRDAIEQVAAQARKIREDIEKRNVTTVEYLAERLSHEIGGTYEDLKNIVNDPLPEEHGERARARARIAKQIINKFRPAYIQVLAEAGVPRKEAAAQFNELMPKLVHVILVIGNVTDEHPQFVEILVFITSMTVLPEIPVFRPILTLLGFGPLGPVRGTTAAWTQKTLFGGVVPSGSWFAALQRAGMKGTPKWLDKIAVSACLTAIVDYVIGN